MPIVRVELAAGVLTFESLKRRRDGVFRSVPVPSALLVALDMVHGFREQQTGKGPGRGVQLWPWSRITGWRAVHDVMVATGLRLWLIVRSTIQRLGSSTSDAVGADDLRFPWPAALHGFGHLRPLSSRPDA